MEGRSEYTDRILLIVDTTGLSPNNHFLFDIAFDSTFQNLLPGWKNRAPLLTNFSPTILYPYEKGIFIEGVYPGVTYFVRSRTEFISSASPHRDTSAYSKIIAATIPGYQNNVILPIQILDSTSVIVRWLPYKDIQHYRLSAINFSGTFETACDEWRVMDSSLVPRGYGNTGKSIWGTRDTIRGLIPGTQYRFRVVIDTTFPTMTVIPPGLVGEWIGVAGLTAEERNTYSPARKFVVPSSLNNAPLPQSISYYESPWTTENTRYFTIKDSNNTDVTSTLIKDYSAPKILYDKMLSRIDSMRRIGIPIDTAYIALEGMLGSYGRYVIIDFPSVGPRCYFARVTCVFTLRHPDARVKQFARPGNGWRSFSWDTDYRRFVFPTATSVRDENTTFASGTPTLQSNPNPFTDETTITYTLPSEASTKVEVFSTLGLRMAVFPMERHVAGTYTIPLQATQWASGTYLVRLTMFDAIGSIRTITHKISLLH